MIATVQQIAENPEQFVSTEIVADLAKKVLVLEAELEGRRLAEGRFVRLPHDESEKIRKSPHYMAAMVALTERRADMKSDCAMMIAEQAYYRELAEKTIPTSWAVAVAKTAELLRKYEAHHRAKNTPDSLEKAEVNNQQAMLLEGLLNQSVCLVPHLVFGEGTLIVHRGKIDGKPGLMVERAASKGKVGTTELGKPTNEDLLHLVFPNMTQCQAVFEALTTPVPDNGKTERKGELRHSSHQTRPSDSSLYDEVCTKCGAHDLAGDGWGKLADPCPGSDGVQR